MKLYRTSTNYPGDYEPAGLEDVLEWFIERYSEDELASVSGYKPALLARIRDLAKILLKEME